MRRIFALALAGTTMASALLAPACSSSSSSPGSNPADSSTGGSDTGSPAESGSGSGGDTGTPSDTGSPSDSGFPSDSGAGDDVVDAPYCPVVEQLIEAGAVGMSAGPCLSQCCAPLTTCEQAAECKALFRCVNQCAKTSDAGASACITSCEVDASSQGKMDVNQLATCLAAAGCSH
jgi:hypothetical protein